jgi:hypothetical protein
MQRMWSNQKTLYNRFGIATKQHTINDFSGNENSVVIEFTGAGDYEFSIDGSYFQDIPNLKE